jgi:predicted  nucleic acid-binding Zn-ribbon protein
MMVMMRLNRKQRRYAASKKGQKRMTAEAKNNEANEANQNQRLNDLLTGKVKPSSEVVDYFVKQMAALTRDFDQIEKQLNNAKQAMTQFENRAKEIRGAQAKCVRDIVHWDKKALEPKEETPPEKQDKEVADSAEQ